MESLQANTDIHTLAGVIERHVNENWEAVFQSCRQEMLDRYDEIGDSVYGIYGQRLFKPIHDQLKLAGMRAVPKLPGSFYISREWGPEDERQRWMWSKITAGGSAVGTIVIVFYHDHYQIRIPRPFRVIALEETSKGAVVEALSRLSPEFKDAREAKIEIAEYLAQISSGS